MTENILEDRNCHTIQMILPNNQFRFSIYTERRSNGDTVRVNGPSSFGYPIHVLGIKDSRTE